MQSRIIVSPHYACVKLPELPAIQKQISYSLSVRLRFVIIHFVARLNQLIVTQLIMEVIVCPYVRCVCLVMNILINICYEIYYVAFPVQHQ